VPDLLESVLLGALWAPPLVLLHELGHALVALAVTDGKVSIELDRAGITGGRALYEPGPMNRARDEALIAVAGPVVSLACAIVLWIAFVKQGSFGDLTVIEGGARVATIIFVASALPIRYGAGLGGGESDGRVIWRVLRGGPPGGIAREARRMQRPDPAARPVFLVVLAVVGVLAFLADPLLGLGIVVLFCWALLEQRGSG
jgi:hypothetical protein